MGREGVAAGVEGPARRQDDMEEQTRYEIASNIRDMHVPCGKQPYRHQRRRFRIVAAVLAAAVVLIPTAATAAPPPPVACMR